MAEYDRTFEWPRALDHSFEVNDEEGRKILYVAAIRHIGFDGIECVRGDVFIEKYLIIPRPDQRRFNFRKFRFEMVSGVKRKLLWSIEAWGRPYIISNGKINEQWGAIKCLKEGATKQGIVLLDALLDPVVRPMEEKLLQVQKDAFRGGIKVAVA